MAPAISVALIFYIDLLKTTPRPLDNSNLNDGYTNKCAIENSVQGVPKGRGTLERARSWPENATSKNRNKRNVRSTRKKDQQRKVDFVLNESASKPVQRAARHENNLLRLTQ